MNDDTSEPATESLPSEKQEAQQEYRQVVRENVRAGAVLSPAYLIMNALAAVVATYGLLQDSTAVVIGAMIIAMLLGPITGIALALIEGDNKLLTKALFAEIMGAVMVFAVGFILGKLHHDLPLGKEITARTAPNILDLAIALAAGAAGAYAALSPRISASLVGVAIATALVPPLCTSAICLSHGLYKASGGAFLLFLANLVAIQSVTSLVLWFHGYGSHLKLNGKAFVQRFSPSILLLGGLAVFLTYSFQQALAREKFRMKAEVYLRHEIEKDGGAHLADLRIEPASDSNGPRVTAVVNAPWVIVPASCARLLIGLRQATGNANIDLHIRSIITRECNAEKFLWEQTFETSSSETKTIP